LRLARPLKAKPVKPVELSSVVTKAPGKEPTRRPERVRPTLVAIPPILAGFVCFNHRWRENSGRRRRAQSSGNELLDEEARRTVSRWRFQPPRRQDQAVVAQVLIPFRLRH